MHKPIKYAEKGLTFVAKAAWTVFDAANRIKPNPSFTPKWSDKPLLKSWQKTKPTLGWPRETDSLCPICVSEARQEILDGKQDYQRAHQRKGRRDQGADHRARRQDPDGQGLPDAWPLRRHDGDRRGVLQAPRGDRSPAATSDAHNDEKLHNHGSSTIKYGRGAVLTVDLTNRCNMMCDPCFMDANQVGFVHELSWDDIKTLLDNAISIKPRRQMSVQFSGGEPTLSPHFLDAVRYARKVGYNSVQAATNGIEFAKSKDFGRQAAEAGLRYAYLQFDGSATPRTAHRHGRQSVRREAASDRQPARSRR